MKNKLAKPIGIHSVFFVVWNTIVNSEFPHPTISNQLSFNIFIHTYLYFYLCISHFELRLLYIPFQTFTEPSIFCLIMLKRTYFLTISLSGAHCKGMYVNVSELESQYIRKKLTFQCKQRRKKREGLRPPVIF